jgi:hypothetical protein
MEGLGACGTPGPSKPFSGYAGAPVLAGHGRGLTPAASSADGRKRGLLWKPVATPAPAPQGRHRAGEAGAVVPEGPVWCGRRTIHIHSLKSHVRGLTPDVACWDREVGPGGEGAGAPPASLARGQSFSKGTRTTISSVSSGRSRAIQRPSLPG